MKKKGYNTEKKREKGQEKKEGQRQALINKSRGEGDSERSTYKC